MDLETQHKKNAYNSSSWWYDLRGLGILWFAYRDSLIRQINFFSKNIGSRHLEVAVGSGSLFRYILKWRQIRGLPRHSKIVAFDYSENMIEGARKNFKRIKDVEVLQGDACHLKFDSESFDTANIVNAFHTISDISKALKETHRVLRPGGRLAFNVLLVPSGSGIMTLIPNRINTWGINKGILHSPYTQEQVQQLLLQAGFKIEFENIKGNSLNILAVRS